MKTKIQEYVDQHTLAKQEIDSMLEELSQIDDSKLSEVDKTQLNCSKMVLDSEKDLRLIFINQLKDLL